MDIYLVIGEVKGKRKVLAACGEKAEAEDIAADKEKAKVEKHTLVNSLGNPWLTPEEQRALNLKEIHLRHKILDMGWCKNVRMVEFEGKGPVFWVDFEDQRIRRNLGVKYLEENFPDFLYEGVEICFSGKNLEAPPVKPKRKRRSSKKKTKQVTKPVTDEDRPNKEEEQ
jgi:hypothetical protein